MKRSPFALRPFSENDAEDLSLTGWASLEGDVLRVRYQLSGRLEAVVIPPLGGEGERRGELWEETCFEFFLSPAGSTRYWEFNLSPAGFWNVYSFQSYRSGMLEETAYSSLEVGCERFERGLILSLDVDLAPIVPPGRSFRMGVSAVIRHEDGRRTYWALRHCGPKPDFHLPQSFTLAL